MTANNDTSRYTSTRSDAWHLLGTAVDDCYTADDAMKQGLLTEWDVRKVQLLAQDSGLDLPVWDTYAVVRNDPARGGALNVLGTVGKAYTVRQNEELAGLLDAIVEETGATFSTAGTIDGGRRAFVTLRLLGAAAVAGEDRVEHHVSVVTGHDGNSSTSFMVTPVHVASASILNLSIKGRSNQFKVRHTSGADRIMAKKAVNFTFKYLDNFRKQADLLQAPLGQNQFDALITRAYGASDDAPTATATRTNNKLEQMSRLFGAVPGAARGTAWAGLTALAEWHDHYSPVRGADGTPGAEARLRARKALLDPGFKDSALRLMMEA